MSEEELIDKMYSMFYKKINENDMRYTDVIYEQIENLQQKVEQLEKENEQLRTQVNTYENPDDMTLFYMWLDEKAKDKIKQLENIRKEAIEYIHEHQLVFELSSKKQIQYWFDEFYRDLLNILNKGSDKE